MAQPPQAEILHARWGMGLVAEPWTGKESVLVSFHAASLDGVFPRAGVVLDALGNLYGTTYRGGNGYTAGGTVFKVDATTRNETVLHSFGSPGDGLYPQAGLVWGAQGNLYGTTSYASGGTQRNPLGTVFEMDTSGNEGPLYTFGSTSGEYPFAGVVHDAQGNLYGTTWEGGAYGKGTVFKLDTAGNETVLYSFTGKIGDGAHPQASLVLDAQGNLLWHNCQWRRCSCMQWRSSWARLWNGIQGG